MVQAVPFFEANGRDEARRLVPARAGLIDGDKAVGGRIRQWLEEDGINGGEDGAVGANAECEREDDRERKAGAPRDGADRGTPIVEHTHLWGL